MLLEITYFGKISIYSVNHSIIHVSKLYCRIYVCLHIKKCFHYLASAYKTNECRHFDHCAGFVGRLTRPECPCSATHMQVAMIVLTCGANSSHGVYCFDSNVSAVSRWLRSRPTPCRCQQPAASRASGSEWQNKIEGGNKNTDWISLHLTNGDRRSKKERKWFDFHAIAKNVRRKARKMDRIHFKLRWDQENNKVDVALYENNWMKEQIIVANSLCQIWISSHVSVNRDVI